MGSNSPIVLTSWLKGKLSRPNVNLFPRKFLNGFSSHRFAVAAIDQAPFVLKSLSTDITGNTKIDWDGYEIRLLKMMAGRLNFTYQVIEPEIDNDLGYLIRLLRRRKFDFHSFFIVFLFHSLLWALNLIVEHIA